jgi:acyl-CoA synthetase (AMP-forming)/AMP-acid ligase II
VTRPDELGHFAPLSEGFVVKVDLIAHQNAADAFAERVAEHPERTALTIYRGPAEPEHESLTFADLARRAQLRAAGLGARLAYGDRVLIALPTGTEFVELYLACLYAGMIAVPAPAPSGSANATDRVAAIAGNCAPAAAFTTDGDRAAMAARLRDHGLAHVRVEVAGDIGPGETAAPLVRPRRSGKDTLAVLQYSSGATGSPKGVMLAHGDILADLAAFGACTGLRPGDSFGSWIPLHHDMGLFAQLSAALLFGAPIVLMPPTAFVRRPVDWLRMLDLFRVTITAAPNFAYDLCQRVIGDELLDGLDLSRLRVVHNGSEPIHAPTMTAFTKRFERAGLQPMSVTPAYGLAEATVFVSAKPQGVRPTVLVADPVRLESIERPELRATAGEGKAIVGVGRSVGLHTRIVDPQTRRALPCGAIGEIWLRGPGIGRGYWNQPELSEHVFAARLADGEDDEPGWLRTGDLGAIVDGELFVTGRIREMLIVHGRNLYPHDLEHEARAAHEALGGCVGAAFGVAVPDERVVLVHEVRPKVPAEDLPAVAAAVTRRLTVTVGAPVLNVMLVRRGTVRRTTSGKIQRGATRARFLAGEIVPLYANLEPGVLAAIGAPDA